jgi:threonylcarbamoyladenosine tRNA methylthiotransferase MtaB
VTKNATADDRPVVSILTLGCKLNHSDSDGIARRLAGASVRVVDRPARGAKAFVINTCSVTHVADRKARHLVRMARRLSPEADIILTGCYAETAPSDIGERTGADIVLRNVDKPSIPDRIRDNLRNSGDPIAGCPTPVRAGLRTRAFVKIQEGCDELCAFCIVPYTRGREVSVPIDNVVQEVQAREADGVIEVVLTGTQLGNYGRDLGWPRDEQGPRRLLSELLDRTSIPRIRLSSLQAQDINAGLLKLWDDPRLCPHFHIPLQSGSDAVLDKMRRRYTAEGYRRAIANVRAYVSDVAVTADVIAGFPGETDDDFQATLRVCEEMQFAAIHCFPYSRRPHTGADKMNGHLPPLTKRPRLEQLLSVARESSETFRRGHIGRVMDVLWEEQSDGLWEGLTGNYIRAYTAADTPLENHLLPVRLTGLHGDGMRGQLEPEVTLG